MRIPRRAQTLIVMIVGKDEDDVGPFRRALRHRRACRRTGSHSHKFASRVHDPAILSSSGNSVASGTVSLIQSPLYATP